MSNPVSANPSLFDPAALRSGTATSGARGGSGGSLSPQDYPWFSSGSVIPGSISLPENVSPATRDQIDSIVDRVLAPIIGES